jgi:hypothetical protein
MDKILLDFTSKLNTKKFMDCVVDIKDKFKGTGITPHNISTVLIEIMKESKKLKKLTGSEKKILVSRTLAYLIEDTGAIADPVLDSIFKSMVPALIDNIIDIGKAKTFKKGRF